MPGREDPLVAFKFGLEIEGKLSGFFTVVGGIGSETEVVDHKVVNENGETIVQKLPGRLTWTEVTLKRGVTSNLDIWIGGIWWFRARLKMPEPIVPSSPTRRTSSPSRAGSSPMPGQQSDWPGTGFRQHRLYD